MSEGSPFNASALPNHDQDMTFRILTPSTIGGKKVIGVVQPIYFANLSTNFEPYSTTLMLEDGSHVDGEVRVAKLSYSR